MKLEFRYLILCVTLLFLSNGFSQVDSLDQIPISKEEAIEIARENGCYIEGQDWYKKCEYLPEKNQWRESSQRYGGKDAKKGKPWTILFIVIDARTGKVIEKGEEHKWGPPPKF